ncbi:ThiF family adenylyltransferase [Oerskovia flava]|uniref:ThiF family adenylyltransferase n=1 Tax=Oerskovia flava TaxID=2986422 RepID=UPI00223EF2A3|nr:ThiF family adenylyltransferase [Oerskovia sp. JB1-3-2]
MTTAPTPGRLTLRPGTDVVESAPGELQYGTDPRWSVRIDGLSDTEARWLRERARQGARSTAGRGTVAAPSTVAPARQDLIDRALTQAAILVPLDPRAGTTTAPAQGAADVAVLSALRADGAGHTTLTARARRSVAVVGLGRLGVGLAATLATAGIGTLVLEDDGVVQTSDVGLGGYRLRDVGSVRRDAARRVLQDIAPSVMGGPVHRPDVVVLVEHRVADPDRARRLMGEGVAHLSVVVREADVVVGPFVRPGGTACLRCLDLHRTDADASWPLVAQQLRDTQRAEPREVEETALAATGAALAASQVLAAVDGLMPRAATACIEIAVPDTVPRLRETKPHPGCGCTDLGRAICADRAGPT